MGVTACQYPSKKKKRQQTTNPKQQQNKKIPPQPHENLYCDAAFAKKTPSTDSTALCGVTRCNSRIVSCTPVVTRRFVPVLLWHLPQCWFSLVVTIALLCLFSTPHTSLWLQLLSSVGYNSQYTVTFILLQHWVPFLTQERSLNPPFLSRTQQVPAEQVPWAFWLTPTCAAC